MLVVLLLVLMMGSCTLCSGGCVSTPSDADDDGYNSDVDCDDHDASVNPGASEVCNDVDDDCDGTTDDGAVDADASYADRDDDGYGDSDAYTRECDTPYGNVTVRGDCDDADADVYPDAPESCDGEDEDCDGEVDEDAQDPPTWYADADADGYGDPATATMACDAGEGQVDNADDCDDTADGAHPGAIEICANAADDDCQEATADSCTSLYVDLADATATLLGRTADEGAGGAVAGAGDVDGDGYGDLLIGAAGTGAGTEGAWWVRGPVSGSTSLSFGDAHLEGTAAGDGAGTSVAGAGDVDDDGYDDVLFGAPTDTDGTIVAGAAWLRYGPQLSGCEPFCDGAVLRGVEDGERVGAAVAGAGDIDGDGTRDVVVGAPGRSGGGGAYLVTGAPQDVVSLADADAVLIGEGSGRAGERVAGPGDVDGDGYDDVGVLDPVAGVAWIVTGRPQGQVSLADAAARLVGPAVEGASIGSFALGDLDGDGAIDAILAATFDGERSADAVAWGAYGPLAGAIDLGAAALVIGTGGTLANEGVEVASGGDIDLDGTDDLLFSAAASAALLAPDYTTYVTLPGSVFLVRGPVASGTLADADVRFGDSALDAPTAAFAGDLDRDGRPDLVIGSQRDDTEGTNAGAAWVYPGASFAGE